MRMFLLKLLYWTLEALVAILSVSLKIFTFFKDVAKDEVSTSVKNATRSNNDQRINSQKSVKRNITPLWQEKGWRKSGNSYRGYYRTKHGSYQGEIREEQNNEFVFFITNPPKCLSLHSHSICFIPKESSNYEIHFNTKARTPDEGIMAIEKILSESHELLLRKQ